MVNLCFNSCWMTKKTFFKTVTYFDFIVSLLTLVSYANNLKVRHRRNSSTLLSVIACVVVYSTSFAAIVAYIKHRSFATIALKIHAVLRIIITTALLILYTGIFVYINLHPELIAEELFGAAIIGLLIFILIILHQVYLSYQLVLMSDVFRSMFTERRVQQHDHEHLAEYIDI